MTRRRSFEFSDKDLSLHEKKMIQVDGYRIKDMTKYTTGIAQARSHRRRSADSSSSSGGEVGTENRRQSGEVSLSGSTLVVSSRRGSGETCAEAIAGRRSSDPDIGSTSPLFVRRGISIESIEVPVKTSPDIKLPLWERISHAFINSS